MNKKHFSTLAIILCLAAGLCFQAAAEDVGGTLAENTTWSAGEYNITSTVTIPEGVTLTIQEGAQISQNSQDYRAFEVNGVILATGAIFNLKTFTDWTGGDRPDERRSAINLYGNASGTFTRCQFYGTEYHHHSGEYYDDWASLITAGNTSSLTVKGCTFESTNAYNGYVTVYGIFTYGGSTVTIGNDGATRTSFKNFRCGIGWEFGDGVQEVAVCDFTDCGVNTRVWGTVKNQLYLNNPKTQTAGGITIEKGGLLKLNSGSQIMTTGQWHDIIVHGTLQGVGARFDLDTWTDHSDGDYPDQRHNGIYFMDGSSGGFYRCVLTGVERRDHSAHYYDDWSAIVHASGTVNLRFQGCDFESLNTVNGRRTVFGVYLSAETTAIFDDYGTGDSAYSNTFKGFRTGIYWPFGSGSATITNCRYEDIETNIRIAGNVIRSLTMPVDSMHTLGSVTVKSGGRLTFPAGSSLTSSSTGYRLTIEAGGVLEATQTTFTMAHQTDVYGKFQATKCDMNHDTWTDIFDGDHPEQRVNGINVWGGAQGVFINNSFKSVEKRDHSVQYYDDWSAIINAEGSCFLVIEGCSFESLNLVNGWVTPFGLRMTGDVDAWIRDYTEGETRTRNSFKAFRSGVGWEFGSAIQRLTLCDFTDCPYNVRLIGNVQRNILLYNQKQYMDSAISVLNAAALTLAPGSELFNNSNRLSVTSGTLTCDRALIDMMIWTDIYDGDIPEQRVNGIDIQGQGTAEFERCTLLTHERRDHSVHYYDDWAAAINVEAGGNLTVRGTSFEGVKDYGYTSVYGIHLRPGGACAVGDYPANPAIRTSFTNYRSGIMVNYGSSNVNIGACDYPGCEIQVRAGGTLTAPGQIAPTARMQLGYALTMGPGGSITFNETSSLYSPGHEIVINAGGSMIFSGRELVSTGPIRVAGDFTAEDTTMLLRTNRDTGDVNWRNAMYLSGNGTATFNNTSIYYNEISGRDYENCIVSVRDTASLSMEGCLLAPHPTNGANYPYHGIQWQADGNLTIKDSIFANNLSTALLVRTTFPKFHWIKNNDFHGNTWAIRNEITKVLTAQDNWWGSSTGPRHATNPGGTGDAVSDFVDFGNHLLESPAPTIELINPAAGQEPDNLGNDAVQNNLELLGFRVSPPSTFVRSIGFRIYEAIGIQVEDLSNLRLAIDANGNGIIDPTETQTAGGTPAVAIDGSAISVTFGSGISDGFISVSNANAGYILIGDLANLKEGDGFKVQISSKNTRFAPGFLMTQNVTPAFHYVGPAIIISDPSGGQESMNFTTQADQNRVELLGFRTTGDSLGVETITFRLSALTGITTDKITYCRLVKDLNGNGQADTGEPTTGGIPEITISGATGSIAFNSAFQISGAFILIADFRNLAGGNTLTAGLSPADIKCVDQAAVKGLVSSATHTVNTPYTLAESNFWFKPGTFGAAGSEADFPLIGFILFPGGRQVNSLTVLISGAVGILPEDISDARLWWDYNGNGEIDGDDILLDTGSVTLEDEDGKIEFNGGFITRGNLIVTADFADLEGWDELTFSVGTGNVEVPAGFTVIGNGPTVRYTVGGGAGDNVGSQNWSLVYRSPGGKSVNGRFNHAGDRLILGYDTGSAWIYDSRSNMPLVMLKEHYDKVMYAGFNSDDSAAVTVTYDGAVNIWDIGTGAKRSTMFSDLLVTSAIPSPDFSKLMIITEGKGMLLDLDLKKRLWEWVPGAATVNSIAYSPDGKYVGIGSSDKRAYIVDAVTGIEVQRFIGHSQAVTAVAFTADGKYFMTSSTDAVVQVWDIATHLVVNTVSLQGQQSQAAAVSNDGTRVAMITGTGNSALLRMFDENGLELYGININGVSGGRWTGTVTTLTFDDAGERVLVTSSGGWAPVACFNTKDGSFNGYWGPSGEFTASYDARPRIASDGDRIFYMSNWGLNIIHKTIGRDIYMAPEIGYRGYDISEDGSRVVWMNQNQLVLDSVSEAGFTRLMRNNVGFTYDALTASPSGSMVICGDRLYSTLTGLMMANYAVPDSEYRGAFSPDGRLWGFIKGADKAMITMRTGDPRALLYNMMLTDPYSAYKMFYHPDGNRVACVDAANGVQMYDMTTYDPVGLYRFAGNSDACLSKDGTMMLISGDNTVRLHDVRTGRILRYFFPQHSGLTSVRVRSVQFAKDDTMIMIAWSHNYIELYERSRPVTLEISPAQRTLGKGQNQLFTVEMEYDDGTREDVSPEIEPRAGLAELTVFPPASATILGNMLTVADNATGIMIIQARYRVGNRTFTAEAIVKVGESRIRSLKADPEAVAVTPGAFRSIRYTAQFDDGYEEDVTKDVVQTASRPEDVVFADKSVKVLFTADPGTILVKGAYTDRWGTSREAETMITSFGPRTEWQRYRVTGGGYGLSGDFSPDGKKMATGSSSGALNIYNVGASPSQYEIERVITAHDGMVIYTAYASNSRLLSVSDEGTIKVWDAENPTSIPLTTYYHKAPITTARISSEKTKIAFGDAAGNVGLLDIASNTTDWIVQPAESRVNALALDADYVLVGSGDSRMRILRRSDGETVRQIFSHTKPIVSVGFLTTNSFFIVSEDRTVSFWRKSDFEILDRYEFLNTPVLAEVIKGQLYLVMENPASTYIYNTDGLLLRWLEHPPTIGVITSLLIDPSNKYVITGRGPKTFESELFMGGTVSSTESFCSYQFWEAGQGIFRGSLAHSFPITDAVATPDAGKIYTQDAKRTMLWKFDADPTIVAGKRLMETGYFIKPSFAGMDATGDVGILATRVGVSIYMYDTVNDLLWKTLHNPGGEGPFAISPNGRRMATADRKTRLWDLISMTQIREEDRLVGALDFRLNDDFLGSIYADKFVGIWNENGLMYNGMQTKFSPKKLIVNSTGTRASVITEEIIESDFATIFRYYLELFDISNPSVEPPKVNQVFLLEIQMDIMGGGEAIPQFCVAVSDDASLAIVGATGQHPVKLIRVNDGSTIREFYPLSKAAGMGNGATAVRFTENDGSIMIAWTEGYAEIYRRVQPTGLTVAVDTEAQLRGDFPDKDALNLSSKQKTRSPAVPVLPGQELRIFSIVSFANGNTLNVTASTHLTFDKPELVILSGSHLIIHPDAPAGPIMMTATYEEPGVTLTEKTTLNVGGRVINADIVRYYILGYINLEGAEWDQADANKDGKVNVADMLALMEKGR